jgi:hypothetical protein
LTAQTNALAESFVDSFKTELIADRVWRTRTQLELAVVEYIGWFNTGRLHSALGYHTPTEYEAACRPVPRSERCTLGPQRHPRKDGTLLTGLAAL